MTTPDRRGFPLILFVALLLVGGGASAVVTFAMRGASVGVLVVNGIFTLTGAFMTAFGVRALRDPTSLQIVDNAGTDASGMAQYANPRMATPAQGRRIGVIALLLGVAALLVGVSFGAIARPLSRAIGM